MPRPARWARPRGCLSARTRIGLKSSRCPERAKRPSTSPPTPEGDTLMQRRTLINTALAAMAAAAGFSTLPVFAQGNWPTGKPITYLVPFAAGGTTDVLGRLIGQKLGTALGTTIIVDNKPGAGGS